MLAEQVLINLYLTPSQSCACSDALGAGGREFESRRPDQILYSQYSFASNKLASKAPHPCLWCSGPTGHIPRTYGRVNPCRTTGDRKSVPHRWSFLSRTPCWSHWVVMFSWSYSERRSSH